MQITIAGNIGSGKTTLTRMLARQYGWTAVEEPVSENPYMADYYGDIRRWSFPMEVFFLKERFRNQLQLARESGRDYVQDRSIYEGVYVFTANNHNMGNLSDRDFDTYMGLFRSMTMVLRNPDLMIYLKASVPHLVANIQKRGRDYEQTMPIDYLQNLNALYEDFVGRQYRGRVLTVDVDGLDFENRPADFSQILDMVDAQLFGLFPASTQSDRNGEPAG